MPSESVRILQEIHRQAAGLPVWLLCGEPERELIDLAEVMRRRDLADTIRHADMASDVNQIPAVERINVKWQDVEGLILEWCAEFSGPRRTKSLRGPLPNMLESTVKLAVQFYEIERSVRKEESYGYTIERSPGQVHVKAPLDHTREFYDALVNDRGWIKAHEKFDAEREELDQLLMALHDFAVELSSYSTVERVREKEHVVERAEVEVTDILLKSIQIPELVFLRDDDLVVGIRTVDLRNVYFVLEAIASSRELVAQALAFNPLHTINASESQVADYVHAYFPVTSKSVARRCLGLLTFSREKLRLNNTMQPHNDYGLWPLIRWGTRLMIPSGLIVGVHIERLLLRQAARAPDLSVDLGKRLDRPDLLRDAVLRSVQTPLLAATNVQLRGPGGERRGDLDLVLIDEHNTVGLIVEIAGGIRPASLREYQQDTLAIVRDKLGKQIPRLRAVVEDPDISIRLPNDWPDFSSIRWLWGVAGAAYLALSRDVLGDLVEVSEELLEVLPEFPSIEVLYGVLATPLGDPMQVVSIERKVGRLTFTIDGIRLRREEP